MNRSIANAHVSLVVPVLNEAENLVKFFDTASEIVQRCGCRRYDFVVIDDGSTDDSATIVQNYQARGYRIQLLSFGRNFGKEAALSAGLDVANGDVVIVLDADLEHPPTIIPELLAKWEQTQALVVSAKKKSTVRQNAFRRLGASFFNLAFSKLAGFDFDGASDFKLLDRGFVLFYRQLTERHRFFRGLVEWSGLPRETVLFEPTLSDSKQTSWSAWSLIRYAINNTTSFSTAPLLATAIAGAVITGLGGLLGLWSLFQFVSGRALTGFATVILLQVIFSGTILLAIGTVAIYLAKISDEVKARPMYVISKSKRTDLNDGEKPDQPNDPG